jgi:hypothetical protein
MAADEPGRYVIHLPVVACDLDIAARIARVMGRTMRLLPHVDPGGITVSREDEQGVHHRVFCDRRLPTGHRCVLRDAHDGPCTRRFPR